LIERALAYEFDAKVDRTFALAGLICEFELPLTREVGYVGDNQVAPEDG
jgi:hypothetical protein